MKYQRNGFSCIMNIKVISEDEVAHNEELNQAGFAIEHYGGVGRIWPIWRSCFAIARKTNLPGPAPVIEG
jgi:hypothetical protein